MANAHGEVIINKPVADVFDYTASAENGPAFIPNLNENTNISPPEPSIDQTFDWRFNMGGVDLTGKASGLAYEVNKRVTLKLEGDVVAEWDYQFEDAGNGTTRLYTEVNYDVEPGKLKSMVNWAIIDRLNQHTINQMLENLKLILESDD